MSEIDRDLGSGDTAVPDDDGLKTRRKNRGKGTRNLYVYNGKKEMLRSGLAAWRWPIVIFCIALIGLIWWKGLPSSDDVPWWVWSTSWYWIIGSFIGIPGSFVLLYFWRDPTGVEVLDLGTPTDEHRHMRIGNELWERMDVVSPWGEEASKAALNECRINGRPGHELMDLRVRDDGTLVCVATWMGEASESALRTYRMSLIYTRRILSKKAEEAEMLKANREHIIREVAERQVAQMIETAEKSGLPDGDAIEDTVSDVLSDLGINDRLKTERDLDVELLDDIEEWDPKRSQEETPDHSTNGEGSPSKIKELVKR